jgi:hypothetical protein
MFKLNFLLDSGGPNPNDFHADLGSKALDKITINKAVLRIRDLYRGSRIPEEFFPPRIQGSKKHQIPDP